MPFDRVLERVRFSPWYCTTGAYAAIATIVDACIKRWEVGAELAPKMEGFSLHDMQSRKPMTIDNNGIAQIHVFGTMGRNLSPIENMCGKTDYAQLEKECAEACSRARGALFEFDTPGGSALGVDQTAKKMAAMSIPTGGFTETLCASAGMYLAAGLGKMHAASGSVIGSIGTVMPWVDTSKMMALVGAKPMVFVNEGAEFKGMRPEIPLTDEQIQHMQDFVNALGSKFQEHITNNRRVDPEVFKAGAYVADQGIDMGLADEVGGRDEALSSLLTKLRG